MEMNQQTLTLVKQLIIPVLLGISVNSGLLLAASGDQEMDEHMGMDSSGHHMEKSADMSSHSDAGMMGHHENMAHSDQDNPMNRDDDGEETTHGLWTKIMMGKHHLAKLVEAGEYGEVHEATETISNLLNKLPGVSTQLTEKNQKRVQGTVNNLTKVLDALHEIADEEGSAALVAAKMKSLNGLFKVLKAQYPAKEKSREMEMPSMKGSHEDEEKSMKHHHSDG